jgi:hypothetical protein
VQPVRRVPDAFNAATAKQTKRWPLSDTKKVPPLPALSKCSECGAPTRLDHLMPHATLPIDHFVYRCTKCSAFTIVDRPRPAAHRPETQELREAI